MYEKYLIDRHGNKYRPVKPARVKAEPCEIMDCNSNSGFACTLSVYDHKDAIDPDSCYHRSFKLIDKRGK